MVSDTELELLHENHGETRIDVSDFDTEHIDLGSPWSRAVVPDMLLALGFIGWQVLMILVVLAGMVSGSMFSVLLGWGAMIAATGMVRGALCQ